MKPWIVIGVALCTLAVTGCGGPNIAQRERLATTQAVIDERVKAGTMTEAEGRMVIARMRADMDAEWRRNYAIMTSGDSPAVYQPVGGGTYIKY